MSYNRKFLIAGNWKMNKTSTEAVDLVKSIILEVGTQNDVGIAICPPFTSLDAVAEILTPVNNIQLGAQNMHHEIEGAYTGEISAEMLRNVYCNYVILGHSERREYFAESNEFINKKVHAALQSSLKPILCVGEKLEEREQGHTLRVVETQVKEGLANVDAKHAEQVVVAYEPVWAIGTGKTATPDMAQEVHGAIRLILNELFGEAGANRVRIIYGGSMKPNNADELLAEPDIDGGLIGGASLDAIAFGKIVASAHKAYK